jgi:hypothetical protein
LLLLWVELECLSTAAANGHSVQATGERELWRVGGMLIGRGNPKYSEKYLSHCHSVHHKSQLNCLCGIRITWIVFLRPVAGSGICNIKYWLSVKTALGPILINSPVSKYCNYWHWVGERKYSFGKYISKQSIGQPILRY